jgi:hypothetical protein
MPGYIPNILSKFQHDNLKHPQDNPSRYVTPFSGTKTQYAIRDETPPLTEKNASTSRK